MRGGTAFALLLLPRLCIAMDLAPDDGALVRAVVDGIAVARAANGYDAREYLIHAVADARDVQPEQGSVDAIVLLTPLERLRHAAYLRAVSGEAIEPSLAAAREFYVAQEVGFRIFSHGLDGTDVRFTERFSSATLRMDGKEIAPIRMERSPASLGRYPRAARERERTVGTVTYWFGVAGYPEIPQGMALLSFRDAEQRALEVSVDFRSRR